MADNEKTTVDGWCLSDGVLGLLWYVGRMVVLDAPPTCIPSCMRSFWGIRNDFVQLAIWKHIWFNANSSVTLTLQKPIPTQRIQTFKGQPSIAKLSAPLPPSIIRCNPNLILMRSMVRGVVCVEIVVNNEFDCVREISDSGGRSQADVCQG